MHPLIERYRAGLVALCHEFGIAKLEVFGSICTGAFDPDRSDVDLIATFADKGPGYADRYLSFADAAERLMGRHVDLITPRSIANRYFQQSVDACRMVIYEQRRADEAA